MTAAQPEFILEYVLRRKGEEYSAETNFIGRNGEYEEGARKTYKSLTELNDAVISSLKMRVQDLKRGSFKVRVIGSMIDISNNTGGVEARNGDSLSPTEFSRVYKRVIDLLNGKE